MRMNVFPTFTHAVRCSAVLRQIFHAGCAGQCRMKKCCLKITEQVQRRWFQRPRKGEIRSTSDCSWDGGSAIWDKFIDEGCHCRRFNEEEEIRSFLHPVSSSSCIVNFFTSTSSPHRTQRLPGSVVRCKRRRNPRCSGARLDGTTATTAVYIHLAFILHPSCIHLASILPSSCIHLQRRFSRYNY